jgi:transcriptional regulator with XRE-family HTH domain
MSMTLGQAIKRRRLELGLSVADFAELIGVGRSCKGYISLIENDKNEPRAKRLQEISNALQCHADDLLNPVNSNTIILEPVEAQ